MTPIENRMMAATSGGYLLPSGVARLKRMMSDPSVLSAFDTWKQQGMTQMILSTLRDFIMNQPISNLNSSDVAVQFGITQGLEIAFQLMQDPSLLIPGIFGRGTQPEADGKVMPAENFDTAADAAIE